MKKIKELRERLNMTQQELSKKLSVSQGAVAMWENGRAKPSSEKLPFLAEILKCEISDLFD